MEYICDLQLYVVNCHLQYITCCLRMGYYVDIYYSYVDVHLQSENNLVRESGQKDCVSCSGIGSGCVTRIS